MKAIKVFYLLIAVSFIAIFSCGDQPRAKELSGGGTVQDIRWEKYKAGFENAATVKKPILMFFYTDWCVYCKKMFSEIFSDKEVASYLNEHFISIKVNPESDNDTVLMMGEKVSPQQLMSFAKINGFPTTIFWSSRRRPVTTIPGYVEKKSFLKMLKYVNQECYEKNIRLDDYLKGSVSCGDDDNTKSGAKGVR